MVLQINFTNDLTCFVCMPCQCPLCFLNLETFLLFINVDGLLSGSVSSTLENQLNSDPDLGEFVSFKFIFSLLVFLV